ncbi:hypothetical protein HY224_02300, partial [Candidatus Uhrbacteria bacterium]|nr:hypothetical protein [Candidatus Uhrbacteria bacterium]
MKFLIFGRRSWLGSQIAEYQKIKGNEVLISQVDVTDLQAINQELVA